MHIPGGVIHIRGGVMHILCILGHIACILGDPGGRYAYKGKRSTLGCQDSKRDNKTQAQQQRKTLTARITSSSNPHPCSM